MLRRFVVNYIARHRNRANQALHVVGLPVTFIAPVVFLIRGDWGWALGCFVAGYAMQFLGHAIEGNDAGEMVLVKKWLGLPYTEFAPGREPIGPNASKFDD
jgi:uncharacterized membrane protein YGL010W